MDPRRGAGNTDSRSRDGAKIEGDSTSYNVQQPKTDPPRPCAKNCGYYGNPRTYNLCSSCYKNYLKILEEVKLAAKKKKDLANLVASSTNPFPCFRNLKATNNITSVGTAATTDIPSTSASKKNRCDRCNKKVGLLGFSCRCEGMFCGVHRYPEEHACKFDFKTSARIALAKENPLCKADKLNNRF